MTTLAIDGLKAPDRTIEDILAEHTIIPKRIGFCSNLTGIRDVCGQPIDDQDIEALELPSVNNRRVFCCAKCTNELLTLNSRRVDPEKAHEPEHWKAGRGARLPKGEDLE